MKITVKLYFNNEIRLHEWESIVVQIKEVWLRIMWQDCYHIVYVVVGSDIRIGQFFHGCQNIATSTHTRV